MVSVLMHKRVTRDKKQKQTNTQTHKKKHSTNCRPIYLQPHSDYFFTSSYLIHSCHHKFRVVKNGDVYFFEVEVDIF